MTDQPPPRIVIKTKKVAAEPHHHGGAWKVAYADFVTALMAFFLLMWLLNATTENQRKGLADYFSPSIPMSRVSGGGHDALWGDSVFADDKLAFDGIGASEAFATDGNQARGSFGVLLEDPSKRLEEQGGNLTGSQRLLEELTARGGESMQALDEMRHVMSEITEKSVTFTIYAKPRAPLFMDADSATMTPIMQETIRAFAVMLGTVPNRVTVAAHVAALPIVAAEKPIWEVTTARAMATRMALVDAGLDPARIRAVTGHGDSDPMDQDPMSIRNSRVEIVILRDGM